MENEPILEMFTLYEKPRDFPNDYIVRKWEVYSGQEPKPCHIVSKFEADGRESAIDYVNRLFANHKILLPRSESDDPIVVGTWI